MRHPGGGGGEVYCRIHRLSDHLNGLKGVSLELLAALLYLMHRGFPIFYLQQEIKDPVNMAAGHCTTPQKVGSAVPTV